MASRSSSASTKFVARFTSAVMSSLLPFAIGCFFVYAPGQPEDTTCRSFFSHSP